MYQARWALWNKQSTGKARVRQGRYDLKEQAFLFHLNTDIEHMLLGNVICRCHQQHLPQAIELPSGRPPGHSEACVLCCRSKMKTLQEAIWRGNVRIVTHGKTMTIRTLLASVVQTR